MVPFKVPVRVDYWAPKKFDDYDDDSAQKVLQEIRRNCGIGEASIIPFAERQHENQYTPIMSQSYLEEEERQ